MPSNKDFYDALTNLSLSAENVNLNVDQVETKLDTANGILTTLSTDIALIKPDVDDIRADLANGVAVTGTFYQATQPVSGSVTALPQTGNVTEASTKTITTGGTHQQVFASNANRKFLLVQNVSDTDMNLGIGYNPSATTGIFLAKSGSGIVFESGFIPQGIVSLISTTTNSAYVAKQA